MTHLAIVCSVIPVRHNLLLRSLKTWQHSIKASGLDCSIHIWSEGCHLYEALAILPPETNIQLAGQEAYSGSPEVGSNYWMRTVKAESYLLLHPEIMLTADAVRVAYEHAKPDVYCSFRIYWIPPLMTETLDQYDWMPPEQLEKHVKPQLNNVRVREDAWESDTCYSLDYETAHKTFPVPEFGKWGPIDPYLAGVRRYYGMTTYNPPNPVYHQAHPRIEGGPTGYAVKRASEELIKRFGRVP